MGVCDGQRRRRGGNAAAAAAAAAAGAHATATRTRAAVGGLGARGLQARRARGRAARRYLDAAPAPGAGGELRCYLGTAPTDTTGATATETVDVAPAPGRLVLFRARDLVHEVRPVVGWRRAALSVWVLRDARDGSEDVS